MTRMLAALCLAALSTSTLAEENPLAGTIVQQSGTSLSFYTSLLPKGWWTIANKYAVTKSAIVAEVTATETACSSDRDSDARVSSTDGLITYDTRKNPTGNTTGYYWQYTGWSLAGLANTYANVFQCDVQVDRYGCNQARPVDLAITVFDRTTTTPRTYTDASGAVQDVVFTTSFALDAIKLPDVVLPCLPPPPPEAPDCGALLTACTAPCQAECGTGRDAAGCKSACVANCKDAVHADVPACF